MSRLDNDQIITGDTFDELPSLSENSVHAIVTDPPYGLAFMGRDWDDFEPKEYQEWCEEWAREALRVLKPGGHMLAFSGNRTHHRLFTGVEDAGFEIRDTVTWHYGSGFPKALDVSKAIQKANGVEPEAINDATDNGMFADDSEYNDCYNRHEMPEPEGAAERWDGFKTALKPATEYVVVARAPLSEGTVAENVQTHGTGALNIDGCRVGSEPHEVSDTSYRTASTGEFSNQGIEPDERGTRIDEGRYPSNVVFDEQAAEALDREVGTLETGDDVTRSASIWGNAGDGDGMEGEGYEDSGGPSRYFYTSKASRAERTLDGTIDNAHPTVKPADLMEWLVRLVTTEGQIVLDPFAGSGTTCRAAKDKARRFVGVERQSKWADVARVRCGLTPDDPSVVRGDDAQSGMENWT